MDIWRAAEVLNRRKWLILLSTVVAAILTFGATRLTGSRWQATVTLISPQTAQTAQRGSTSGTSASDDDASNRIDTKALKSFYSTMLLSRQVVEPAYRATKEPLPAGTNLFRDVEFDVIGPRLFALHVTNSQPEKAASLANALADSFVNLNHGLNTQEAEKVVHLLEAQMRIAERDLAKAREKYRQYSSTHKVLGTPDDEARSAHSEIDEMRSRRNQVQEELAAATVRLSDVEHRLAQVSAQLAGPRPVQTGPHAKPLADELDRIESKLASLQARYGSQYPEIKESLAARDALRTHLKTAQREEAAIATYDDNLALRDTLQRNAAELRPKVAEYRSQTATLDAAVASAEARVLEARKLGDPYGSLASEAAARAEARASLVTRLNNAQMALDVAQRQNPIVIMERANELNPAINITAGKTKKLILLAALCALMGSCGIVIGLDSLDRRVKNVHEAELLLPAPVLAAIPQPEIAMSYSALARVAKVAPRSLPSEAYRFLGLHLLSPASAHIRSLMVVSAKAEQGSTTTVTNLAITLAQAGKRVVLVDTNVRTPELHQVFQIPNEFGFTDLLMDPTSSSFERALLPTDVENLQIVTSGSDPENPWELFRSSNLRAVSRRLHEIADYVLYDTPSGVLFTDALNLAPIVDGAFLCIRALETPTGVEKRLIEQLEQVNVKTLGAVLNDVPLQMVAGYDNYQHYYAPALPTGPAGFIGAPSNKTPDGRGDGAVVLSGGGTTARADDANPYLNSGGIDTARSDSREM